MSFINKLLNIIILLCVYLNRGFTEGAQERESGRRVEKLIIIQSSSALFLLQRLVFILQKVIIFSKLNL